ncbi:FmdB family zinc ribbon protein [Bradymonas sediminis]|uniref:Zinc ribbon domain-containing protein n=1 Tax=Bradymonas sediminis TaxID=1548548 RepID=A0A2Z4FR23_9DELT|nr:zinc ribbon domain-containing protein [Bradymonas sediminis]AWV91372.1 zinc ribbon domain-containing protein [Bradymonas sediminis]TDP64498.1 putative FmdB family regulatory protein [Bradymonas sediminis]
MPIYKYECTECGHHFEDLRSFSEPDPEECPSCQADAVQKLITGGNFVLKGSGWYVTDYASNSGGRGAPAKADAAPASSASSGDAATSTNAD